MRKLNLGQNRTDILIICTLFLVSVGLRLLLLFPSRFDGLYGQDAYAYYDYARSINHSLASGIALKPFFWPLGYPTLLALSFATFGTGESVAQAVSIVMGALLTLLLYSFARQIKSSRSASILAALLMTLCGQALQSSLVVMSDIPSLFWATLSALLVAHYLTHKPGQARYLALAALTFTLASITRWIYLTLGLPFGLAVLIHWRGRLNLQHAMLAIVAALLVLLPQIIYSRTNPNPTLNHEWVQGWSPANAFRSSFTNIDGHFDYAQINALFYARPIYDTYYLSPIFTPLALIGLCAVRRRAGWMLILVAGWIFLPYLFLVGIPYQNIRFPLIVVPALAVLISVGFDSFAGWLRQTTLHPLARRMINALTAILVLFGTLQMWNRAENTIESFINHQQSDKEAAAWAEKYLPSGATLYTFGLTLTLRHYTSLNILELYYETPATLAEKWRKGQSDYLLLNVWNIENQWAGRDLQFDYHWLRDERGLIRIGTMDYYTLYRIRG